MLRVLFVCLGNICRSPTAHGVLLNKLTERNWQDIVDVDSAGTASWHVGKKPDSRTIQAALTRGYDLEPLRARQVTAADFYAFDYILAMDESNLENLRGLKPADSPIEPQLFLQFACNFSQHEVPDPYYGGEDGFMHVIDLVEDGCNGLLDYLAAKMRALS